MGRNELLKAIVAKTGRTPESVKEVLDVAFDEMTQSICGGDRVVVQGFGSFSLRDRKGFEKLNPRTGEAMSVPPRRYPHFIPSEALRMAANRG